MSTFFLFSLSSVLLWIAASFLAWLFHRRSSVMLYAVGIVLFASYIGWIWWQMERPPLRTMGEVRLWYSLFLSITGLFLYIRFNDRWMLLLSSVLSTVFIVIGLCRPELFDKTMPPALQSVWFVPHVSVYMFSYSILSIATILAYLKPSYLVRRLVLTGCGLLGMGMVMGALWAKEAWGDYWSWDPKETWAAATWLSYLIYIHANEVRLSRKYELFILTFSFILLQMCWYGVSYLPSAQQSIHLY